MTDIFCYRCKDLLSERPLSQNYDYVKADDITAVLKQDRQMALLHNAKTLEKLEKKELIDDSEYDKVPLTLDVRDVKKVITEYTEELVQGLGVVCNDCVQPTDTVIWGLHKRGLHKK